MWLQAKTAIKLAGTQDGGPARLVDETSPPFETDEATAAELLGLDAAEEVDAPPAVDPPADPAAGADKARRRGVK